MIIFLSLIIPFITALVLFLVFKHRTTWWELSIPLVASVLFAVIFKWIALSFVASDTEYLNDTIVEARYYEEWNEWIEETCEYPCGEDCDSEGQNCTTVYCEYDCSYQETHSAYYEIKTSTGWTMRITKAEYNRLVKKFNVKPVFVDMHRDYDTKDGDMYKVIWDGSDEKLECVVTTQSYENKTQVSKGIYNYPDVTPEEVEKYDLYDYPGITENHKQDHLLGSNDKEAEHNLAIINGRLGPKRQLKAFVLLFDAEQTIDAGYKQRDYWEGGNKNEFVVCIGLSKNGKAAWCLPFTWSDDAKPEVEIRNFVMKQKEFDLVAITEKMNKSLQTFDRKEFADFEYLQVYPTTAQIVWCFILTFLLNIGLSIWIINNEFHSEDSDYNRYNNRTNDRYYNRRKKLDDMMSRYKFRGFR